MVNSRFIISSPSAVLSRMRGCCVTGRALAIRSISLLVSSEEFAETHISWSLRRISSLLLGFSVGFFLPDLFLPLFLSLELLVDSVEEPEEVLELLVDEVVELSVVVDD